MTRAAGRRLGVRDTQLPRYEHEQKTRISDVVSCGGGIAAYSIVLYSIMAR